MFGEKGIILKTGLAKNVKATIGVYEDHEGNYRILCKPSVRRLTVRDNYTNEPYKTWLSIREIYAMVLTLQRAASLMEEYYEGSLELDDILAEDEDARILVATDSVMYPSIDNMFSMESTLAKEKEEAEKKEKP